MAGVGFLALVPPAWAVRYDATAPVDLALVIAVDVSTSRNDQEQRVQREGYISALLSPEVMRAIKSGRRGKIALTYLEWARPEYQRVLVPWTVIETPADASAAAKLSGRNRRCPRAGPRFRPRNWRRRGYYATADFRAIVRLSTFPATDRTTPVRRWRGREPH